MTTALIGYTGFVGSTLLTQTSFDYKFNRANLAELRELEVDHIICAGLPAAKWIANAEPEADRHNIARLEAALTHVKTKEFTLISTVDVFSSPLNVTEATAPQPGTSYGKHRLAFEEFVKAHFPSVQIIRLPALFGTGLKKNVLFDLMHRNQLEHIDPASAFQWYPMRRLWADMMVARNAGLGLVHFATEPLKTRLLIDRFFPKLSADMHDGGAPQRYDMRTIHASLWRQQKQYILEQEDILVELGRFLNQDEGQPS